MNKKQVMALAAASIGVGFVGGAVVRGPEEPAPAETASTPVPVAPPVPKLKKTPVEVLSPEEERTRLAGLERQAKIKKRLNELREEAEAAKRENRQPDMNVNDGGAP